MASGPFLHHRVHAIRYGDGFFKRHGSKAVFLGRWIALVRFATAWLAGINRMPIKRFFFWNALGGITWGITYGLVGYFGGKAAAHVLAQAGLVGLARHGGDVRRRVAVRSAGGSGGYSALRVTVASSTAARSRARRSSCSSAGRWARGRRRTRGRGGRRSACTRPRCAA